MIGIYQNIFCSFFKPLLGYLRILLSKIVSYMLTDILQTMEVLMLKSVQFSYANTLLFSMSCGLDKIFNVSILITVNI